MALGQATLPVNLRSASNSKLSTKSFLRIWLISLAGLFAVNALVAATGGLLFQGASETLANDTGPALVQVQGLSSSLAEANAEATASFLATTTDTGTQTADETEAAVETGATEAAADETEVAGEGGEESEAAEDAGDQSEPALSTDGTAIVAERPHHNRYLAALARSGRQAEDVSASVGDSQSAHDALKDISVSITAYSGKVAEARTAKTNGIAGADERLLEALIEVDSSILPSVDVVNARLENDLTVKSIAHYRLMGLTFTVSFVILVVLVWGQISLARRTKRLIAPFLLLSTVVMLISLVITGTGIVGRHSATNDAITGGYDSIATVAEVQSKAFRIQSAVGVQLLDQSPQGNISTLINETNEQIGQVASLADSTREQAAASELQTRWDAYQQEVKEIRDLKAAGKDEEANARFEADGVSSFTGVNTTLDGVLADNRSQFLDGLNQAASSTGFLPYLGTVASVLAAILAIFGVQRRQVEYR